MHTLCFAEKPHWKWLLPQLSWCLFFSTPSFIFAWCHLCLIPFSPLFLTACFLFCLISILPSFLLFAVCLCWIEEHTLLAAAGSSIVTLDLRQVEGRIWSPPLDFWGEKKTDMTPKNEKTETDPQTNKWRYKNPSPSPPPQSFIKQKITLKSKFAKQIVQTQPRHFNSRPISAQKSNQKKRIHL